MLSPRLYPPSSCFVMFIVALRALYFCLKSFYFFISSLYFSLLSMYFCAASLPIFIVALNLAIGLYCIAAIVVGPRAELFLSSFD
ncbi:MAG: hypothetical protein MHMPM18_001612 [Marteilia pararefringens]